MRFGTWQTWLLTPLLLIAGGREDPVIEFEEGLRKTELAAGKGKWQEVERTLIELLQTHAGEPFVRMHLPDIRQRLRDAAFWSTNERPDEKELLSGKLKKYDRFGGSMAIEYGPEGLADFELIDTENGEGSYYLHPAIYRDSYRIEVKGKYRSMPVFLVGMEGSEGYAVLIGDNREGAATYREHQISRLDRSGTTILDRSKPKERRKKDADKSGTVKISVSKKTIKVTVDGRQALSIKKEDETLGAFGFFTPARFEELSLQGKVEPSWIEGLVDAVMVEERALFDRNYVEPDELAAWPSIASAEKSPRSLAEMAAQIPFPDRFYPEQSERVDLLTNLISKEAFGEARALIERMTNEDLPEASREFLLGIIAMHQRSFLRSVKHLEQSLAVADEPSIEMRNLHANMLWRVERFEQGIEAIRAMLEERPLDPSLHYELSELYLLKGDIEQARQQINQGLGMAPADEDLLELRSQIVKAQQGPAWEKTFEEVGERFIVASEYDRKICRTSELELERTLTHLEEEFGALPADVAPLPVFLFAGEAGYTRYIEGIAYEPPQSTAGIYSPRLRQILVWNVSSRDELYHTLRHEALHHYLDEQLGWTPRWFNEGLAETVALSRSERGGWTESLEAESWTDILSRYGWKTIPLDVFLHQNDEEFMLNAQLCYAQSWALVAFLRNTEPNHRAFFDRLWVELEGQTDPSSAVDRALSGVDLDQMQRAFEKFIDRLRREAN